MKKLQVQLAGFIALGMLASVGAQAADESAFNVSGFIDAQYQFSKTSNVDATHNIQLNDAALYFNHNTANSKILIDLPFAPDTATDQWSLGMNKAQAYFEYKYDFGMRWRLGQFDAPFGFEATDSHGILFSRAANMGTNVGLPGHFTGLMAGYDLGTEMAINVMVSNSPNKLSMTNEKKPTLGLQYTFNSQMLRLALGTAMYRTTGNNYLFDVVVGTTLGDLALDLQWDYVKQALVSDAAMGFLLNGGYTITDMISAGLRGEYSMKGVVYSQFGVTAGPQFKMNKNVTVKVDYSMYSTKAFDGADSVTSHAATLAGVYKI